MDSLVNAGARVNSDDLERIIKTCESASDSVLQIIHALRINGQSALEWAGDAVSLDVAGHYIQQLWAGANCTYSSMNDFQKELLSVIETLRRSLADYSRFDGMTAESLEQL
jgi:hypothetical protein